MKLSLAALAFLLLMATFALADGSPGEATKETQDEARGAQNIAKHGSGHCCMHYEKRPVPLKLLASYEYAGSTCPIPAIIFITKKNKMICGDPDDEWVKDRIHRLPPP